MEQEGLAVDVKMLTRLAEYGVIPEGTVDLLSNRKLVGKVFRLLNDREISMSWKHMITRSAKNGRFNNLSSIARRGRLHMKALRLARRLLDGEVIEVKSPGAALTLTKSGDALTVDFKANESEYRCRVIVETRKKWWYGKMDTDFLTALFESLLARKKFLKLSGAKCTLLERGEQIRLKTFRNVNCLIKDGVPPSIAPLLEER